MSGTTGTLGVDQKNGPLSSARARCKDFGAVYDITAVDPLDSGAGSGLLLRCAGLRLAAPGDPLFRAAGDPRRTSVPFVRP